jgi:alpha-tubulin suppressor-like RCC1 family protein
MIVSTGGSHTCLLFTGIGKIKCWGSNSNGQLGNKNIGSTVGGSANELGTSLDFVDFGVTYPRNVVSVQAGWVHTCVLFDNSMLKCFGANSHGQLGLGNVVDSYDTVYMHSEEYVDMGAASVLSMHLGSFHTCVLLDTTEVKCFGLNQNGQLGLGDTRSRGRFGNEMGLKLPAVQFGSDRYAVRLFNSGGSTMCVLLNSAELKCWGDNQEYALGMGIVASQNIGDAVGEMGDNLVAIELPTGKNVVNVWVSTHVVVLFDDHTMATGGRFDTDQSQHSSTGSPKQTMGNQLQIIHPGTGRKPVQVMLNRFSTIILFDNGDVVGLGMNQERSLGLCTGSVNDPAYHVSTQTRTTGGLEIADTAAFIYFDERSPHLKIKGLASNSFTNFCVITAENEVICWGANNHGQLGWPPEGL